MAGVKLKDAHDPLVLAIDIGSTATRARVYDATGAPVRGRRQRRPHSISTRPDGTAEIDPEAMLRDTESAITALMEESDLGGRIAGVAMDTFASSLVGVDATGKPLTPCYTYADARPAAQVLQLRAEMDETAVQQRTGCRFSTSYLPARLRWLQTELSEVTARVDRWLSLGEFIYSQLIGTNAVSFSTAAWTGLLDRREGTWDAALIEACGARVGQFSPVTDTAKPLSGGRAAKRWPALERAKWFPAVADGYASNVGSGATDAGTMALSAATSGALRVLVQGSPEHIPAGLWCYRVDRRRSLLGGALNDVGRVVSWLTSRLQLPPIETLDRLLLAPPDGTAPDVLPFLTGERSPGWAAGAHAALANVSDATTPAAIFRGAMEGVALRFALIAGQLHEASPSAERVLASGGVTEILPGWLQVAADALGRPVTRVAQPQATMRGTALIALDVLAPSVPRAPAAAAETYAPDPEHARYYAAALARQRTLYARLIDSPQPSPVPA